MRKADDLIQRFLDSIGQSGGSVYVGLFRSWQSIVGERIAAHAQPVDLRGHSLVVEADHPGWVQMVMMKREHILRELNRRFPELTITGLAVRVVDRPGAARPGTDRPENAGAAGSREAATGADASRDIGARSDVATPAPSGAPAGGRGDSASASSPPEPPTRDENEALERIEDDELRDALARLRKDLDQEPSSDE